MKKSFITLGPWVDFMERCFRDADNIKALFQDMQWPNDCIGVFEIKIFFFILNSSKHDIYS